MHCRMAECSLSTGTSSPPPRRAAAVTRPPAITSVSLFASATRFPAPSAAIVARKPAAPTTALITVCTSSRTAALTRHSAPTAHPASAPSDASTMPTNDGRCSAACARSSVAFVLAVSARTRKPACCRARTRSAVVPTEPVEPRIAMPRGVMIAALESAARSAAGPRPEARTAGCRHDPGIRRARAATPSCPSPSPRA